MPSVITRWLLISTIFALECESNALTQSLSNPRSWKALGAAQKAYSSLKDSKAIANLPSHISRAKAALQTANEQFQTQNPERERQPQILALDPSGGTTTRKSESIIFEKPNDIAEIASKREDCPAGNERQKLKGCFTVDQISLPVLALCLLSGLAGWLIGDHMMPNKIAPKTSSIEEMIEELSKSSRNQAAEAEEGEPEVSSDLKQNNPTSAADSVFVPKKPSTPVRKLVYEDSELSQPSLDSGNSRTKERDPDCSPSSENKISQSANNQDLETAFTPSDPKTDSRSKNAENLSPAANPGTNGGLTEADSSLKDCDRVFLEEKDSACETTTAKDTMNSTTPLQVSVQTCQTPVKLSDTQNSKDSGSIVRKKSDSSPGWLEKADTESHLLPEVGIGGVLDLVAVMKFLAVQSGQNADRMSSEQRMQLQQMSIQYCQQQQNNWLHAQANVFSKDTLDHRREEAEKRDSRLQQDRMRMALQDGLVSGLWLTLAMSLFNGIKFGYLGHQLGKCPSVESLPAFGFWRPWAALEAGKLALCYIDYTREALLGSGIMLATAYGAIRAGAFSSSAHDSPILKLVIALGLICGFAGFQAVGRLGGDSSKWLLCWETWIAMHGLASYQLPRLQSSLAQSKSGGVKSFAYQACLSVVFPLIMATVPFPGSLAFFQKLFRESVLRL